MNSPRLLILLVALMMLPLPVALGAMTTEYTREDENGSKTTVESVTLDLAAGESDDLTSVVFPNSEPEAKQDEVSEEDTVSGLGTMFE